MQRSIPTTAALAAAALLCAHRGSPARADTVQVTVDAGFFTVQSSVPGQGTPDATINAGDTVVWQWTAPFHSVTSDQPGLFDSGVHSPPFTFQFTFNDPGVYPFYCSLHGAPGGLGMSGTITVLGGGCPADWNGDTVVNSSDISAYLTAWLDSVQNGNLIADFSGDMVVNSSDISAFLTAWLQAVQSGC